MRVRRPAIVLITVAALLSGCASYTARDAMPIIAIPEHDPASLPVTKHSVIVAEREAEKARLQEAGAQETIIRLQERIEALQAIIAAYEGDDTAVQLEAIIEQRTGAIDGLSREIEQLKAQVGVLQAERQTLAAQLQSANLSLDAQRRIEAEAEQQRIFEEEQRQMAQREEQERLKLLEQAEAERTARERELARLIPPPSLLTYPHRFITSDAVTTLAKGTILKTMLLPLSDRPWKSADLADSVAASIADLDYPILFVTGAAENVSALVRRIGTNATLVEGGAIITALEVLEASTHAVRVRLNAEQTVRLALANLVEYEVITSFLAGGEGWKEVQKRVTADRLKTLLAIIREGSIVEPTILASSLYEPSHQDWSSFSPVAYRQIDYLWPLCVAVEDEQFLDTYRLTHFSAATDSGNTIARGEIRERVDYLFSRKILPLRTAILPIGGQSAARDGEVQRWAIAASLLIP